MSKKATTSAPSVPRVASAARKGLEAALVADGFVSDGRGTYTLQLTKPKKNKKPVGDNTPRDFWGHIIEVGDTIAAPIFMRGFTTYVARVVTAIDATGALSTTNRQGEPSKARILSTKKTFKESNP